MDVDCYQAECDSYVGNERNIIDQLEQEQTKTDVLGQLAGWSPTKISHKYKLLLTFQSKLINGQQTMR